MNLDKLVACKHCDSDFCYEVEQGEVKIYSCMTCGFTTNNFMTEDSELWKEQQERLPELYKEVAFKDKDGLMWFPSFAKVEGKGMVYLQGTNIDDSEWVGVLDVEIPEKQREKFPIPNKLNEYYKYKTDMTTLKKFGKGGFLRAVYYVEGGKI